MLEGVVDAVSAAPWAYAVIAAIVALDAFFPIVPGETAVITGGLLAAQHELTLSIVLVAAFAGVLVGDNVSFLLGRVLGKRACRRLFRGTKDQRRLEWAARGIAERGRLVLLAARFIPGGADRGHVDVGRASAGLALVPGGRRARRRGLVGLRRGPGSCGRGDVREQLLAGARRGLGRDRGAHRRTQAPAA